jgi:hypothetical protein
VPDFLQGVNLPWLEYGQDFGASAWRPAGGVAVPGTRERLRRELGRVAEAGGRVVRWWLLGDGRSGLTESPSGRGVRLGARLLDDLDAAVEELQRAGLQAIFVLLDFQWFSASRVVGGVQLGGRTHLVRDPACRERLLSEVMRPIAAHQASSSAIAAWDLCNEPEWATLALGTADLRHALSHRRMRGFLAELAGVFRRHASQPLTVGSASARWLALVDGLDLDFHQVHWYESLDCLDTLRRPRHPSRTRPPLLLGEFATRGCSLPSAEVIEIAREAGYCGALPWSLLAEDRATSGAESLLAVRSGSSERARVSSARPRAGSC